MSPVFKLIFTGDQAIGKTRTLRIASGWPAAREERQQSTVGFDLFRLIHGKKEMMCWDCTGARAFDHMLPAYCINAAVAVVCYRPDVPRSIFSAESLWGPKTTAGATVLLALPARVKKREKEGIERGAALAARTGWRHLVLQSDEDIVASLAAALANVIAETGVEPMPPRSRSSAERGGGRGEEWCSSRRCCVS